MFIVSVWKSVPADRKAHTNDLGLKMCRYSYNFIENTSNRLASWSCVWSIILIKCCIDSLSEEKLCLFTLRPCLSFCINAAHMACIQWLVYIEDYAGFTCMLMLWINTRMSALVLLTWESAGQHWLLYTDVSCVRRLLLSTVSITATSCHFLLDYVSCYVPKLSIKGGLYFKKKKRKKEGLLW